MARVDPDRMPCGPASAYFWLTRWLRERKPGWSGRLPWWCYPVKPDLRLHRWARRGPQVRLELLVEAERVESFPLWAWSEVFCGGPLFDTRREEREWWRLQRRRYPGLDPGDSRTWPPAVNEQVEATWERLFAPDLPATTRAGLYARCRLRDAVIEEIRREDVRRVSPFQGHGHGP